tara:strand:- start:375 stop:602 length:228 start_codon:yes stop_codon:yes gene_type:complete
MKTDLEKFNEIVDDVWELVFGTERRPKPKRARTKKGRYKADDPTTKDYNEAYVGGKAPSRKELLGLKKKKTKRKK